MYRHNIKFETVVLSRPEPFNTNSILETVVLPRPRPFNTNFILETVVLPQQEPSSAETVTLGTAFEFSEQSINQI